MTMKSKFGMLHLGKIKRHMTFSEINYILQSEGLANYFEYAEALSELLSSGHIVDIVSQGRGTAVPPQRLGGETARTFERTSPSVRKIHARRGDYLPASGLKRKTRSRLKGLRRVPALLCISDIGSDLLNLSLLCPPKRMRTDQKRFLCDPPSLPGNHRLGHRG